MINPNEHLEQLKKDWQRLYPNGDTDNPLYEALCRAKGESITDESSQIKERKNNALWCCDKIEELIKTYKTKCGLLSSIGNERLRAQALVYHEIIRDLETILHGETYYE